MRYVSQDGYAARFSSDELDALLDRDGSGERDQEAWEAAATDAEAEVDAYLGQRYQLPLAHVPEAVQWAAYAVLRARLNPFAGEDSPARRVYDDAHQWLRRVARGEVGLGLPEDQAEETTGSRVAVRGGRRRYTERFFERYR